MCGGRLTIRIQRGYQELVGLGVHMTDSSEVPALTLSEIRPLATGIQAAVNYQLAWRIVKNKAADKEKAKLAEESTA